MTTRRSAFLLLLPGLLVFLALVVAPAATLLEQSLRRFVPGRIGASAEGPFVFENYAELVTPSFAGFLIETFWLSLIATVIGLAIAFPLAYLVARRLPSGARVIALGFLVTLMFLSVLVRTYAIEITFGSVGPVAPFLRNLGISTNSRAYIEIMVILGLLHYVIPLSALTLVSTIQNLDPRLVEAAEALGAPSWKAHATVTLPLSSRGLLSAFLMSYTFCISAFVIPMILGKGRVQFVSNLIYNRFSEIANYPSGAAISLVMLAASLFVVYFATRLMAPSRSSK